MRLSYRNQKNAKAIAAFWGKPLDKKEWFTIKSQSDDDEAEILIFDVIGWPWLEAQAFVVALSELGGKDVTVRIASPGGDIVDAVAIFNSFEQYKGKVTTKIESLAASSASLIALAGDEVQAYKNALMMIHDPWMFTVGNQYELRADADVLSKFSSNLVDAYSDNSNIGKRDIKAMMKDETWFTAKEMKDKGLIDTIIDKDGAKAKFDLSIFANMPDNILDITEGDKDLTIREIERALRDAGASQKFAKAFVAGRYKGDDQRDVDNLEQEPNKADQRDVEIANNIKTIIEDMTGGYKHG